MILSRFVSPVQCLLSSCLPLSVGFLLLAWLTHLLPITSAAVQPAKFLLSFLSYLFLLLNAPDLYQILKVDTECLGATGIRPHGLGFLQQH